MKTNKCSKLVCNLYDKNNYVVHIRSLKQALNHGLILKKVQKVIQFNQEAWLKEYIDMNTELRKQAKDELGGKIMTKFPAPRLKSHSYLMDDDSESKKAKGKNKCVIKRLLKFNDYKNCVLNNEIIIKSQQRFKSEAHNVCTEEFNYCIKQ